MLAEEGVATRFADWVDPQANALKFIEIFELARKASVREVILGIV
jgi:hypothetical protein